MSSGTNQERIEQNNLKLAQLKTKADNLPEYQDIEPIYASLDYNKVTINASDLKYKASSTYNNIYILDVYENYLLVIFTSSSNYKDLSLFINK